MEVNREGTPGKGRRSRDSCFATARLAQSSSILTGKDGLIAVSWR
jgi:hypothetical protein